MGHMAPIRQAAAKPAAAPAPMRPRSRSAPAKAASDILQAKFALGPRTDAFEREADSAAAHVVGGHGGVPSLSPLFGGAGLAQRACAACSLGGGDDETRRTIQRKCSGCGGSAGSCGCADKKTDDDPHPELQIDRAAKRSTDGDGGALRAIEHVVTTPGRPLPKAVRGEMSKASGAISATSASTIRPTPPRLPRRSARTPTRSATTSRSIGASSGPTRAADAFCSRTNSRTPSSKPARRARGPTASAARPTATKARRTAPRTPSRRVDRCPR